MRLFPTPGTLATPAGRAAALHPPFGYTPRAYNGPSSFRSTARAAAGRPDSLRSEVTARAGGPDPLNARVTPT